eukprot:1161155-Pelagomonas_calceolata.AAC.5
MSQSVNEAQAKLKEAEARAKEAEQRLKVRICCWISVEQKIKVDRSCASGWCREWIETQNIKARQHFGCDLELRLRLASMEAPPAHSSVSYNVACNRACSNTVEEQLQEKSELIKYVEEEVERVKGGSVMHSAQGHALSLET